MKSLCGVGVDIRPTPRTVYGTTRRRGDSTGHTSDGSQSLPVEVHDPVDRGLKEGGTETRRVRRGVHLHVGVYGPVGVTSRTGAVEVTRDWWRPGLGASRR